MDGPVADGVTVGLLAAGGLFVIAIRRYPVMTGFPESESVARTRVVEGIEGTDLSAGATGTVALTTTKGRRLFQYSVSAVDSSGNAEENEGDPVARAVVFRDVTDRQTREQRLTVLREIALACPDELTISSHPAVVRRLLSELVENAVRHTDKTIPRVEITVHFCSEATAEMIVADDGPGIPERERAILSDGIETPLAHGRGVGLWTVR
jgi:signal transduction histidine kinase